MGLQTVQASYLTRTAVILLLCALDCCINAVADHPAADAPGYVPYVFVGVQLALQLVNLLLVFMLFSGTYLFQVGLVGVQVREFCSLLGCALAYTAVYVAYAGYKCSLLPALGADGVWDDPAFVFLSLAQKLASLPYYLVMLAVCSRMGEVVWYSRASWISRFSGAPSAV